MSFTDLYEKERMSAVITGLELKLNEVRATVESILASLELQEKVHWPELLEKFTSAAHELSLVQSFVKRTSVFSSGEDGPEFLRRQVVVPRTIRPDEDPELAEMTNGRLPLWNHDTVPLYMRTKLDTETEMEEQSIEASFTGDDKVCRQLSTMTKNIEQLVVYLTDQPASMNASGSRTQLTYKSAETERLVRAVNNGEGLMPAGRSSNDYSMRNPNPMGRL